MAFNKREQKVLETLSNRYTKAMLTLAVAKRKENDLMKQYYAATKQRQKMETLFRNARKAVEAEADKLAERKLKAARRRPARKEPRLRGIRVR